MAAIAAQLFAIWFMLLGLSIVAGQAPGGKWFVNASKKVAMKPIKAGGKAAKNMFVGALQTFWCTYKHEIIACIAGAGFMKLFVETPFKWWVLAVLLIAISGWLIGLGLSSRQGRRCDYLAGSWEYIANGAAWVWIHYPAQATWFCVGASVYIIYG